MKTHELGLPWNHSRLLSHSDAENDQYFRVIPDIAVLLLFLDSRILTLLKNAIFYSLLIYRICVPLCSLKRVQLVFTFDHTASKRKKWEITVQYIHHDSVPIINTDVEIFPLFLFENYKQLQQECCGFCLCWTTRWRMCWSSWSQRVFKPALTITSTVIHQRYPSVWIEQAEAVHTSQLLLLPNTETRQTPPLILECCCCNVRTQHSVRNTGPHGPN